MVRAAVTGALDFTRADPREPNWWAGLRLVLNEIERAEELAAARDHLGGLLAAMSRDTLTGQANESIAAAYQGLQKDLQRVRFPWASAHATATTDAAQRLRAQWVDIWGDPESPETQARIERTVAALERVRVKTRG